MLFFSSLFLDKKKKKIRTGQKKLFPDVVKKIVISLMIYNGLPR